MSLRNISVITGLPYDVPEIVDITDLLPRRGTWENYAKQKIVRGIYYWADGTTTDYWTDKKQPLWLPSGLRPDVTGEEIDTIIVHHTASTAPLANQANYHVNTHLWPGIAYHLTVDEEKIKQTNDLLSMIFHAGGHNTYTVSICVNADLSKREMTSRERELLYAAILTVNSVLPIKYIKGHNEVNATACPCTSMDRIRQDVQTLEMKLKQQETWQARLGKINDIVNQINYMNDLAKKGPEDGEARWAVDKQIELHELMKQTGLL